jgi:hypothetical protein
MPRREGVRYYCRAGSLDSRHSKPVTVSEKNLLPWAQAEVLRGLGSHTLELRYAAKKNEDKRQRLERERDNLIPFIRERRLAPGKIEEELTRIDAELAALGPVDRAIEAIVMKPAIRWDAPAGEVNERLRELWRSLQLGPDLRPVSADWYLSLEESAAAEDALTATIRENW